MKTMVAAPICARKDYSLHRWAAATKGHDRLLATEEKSYVPVIESWDIPAVLYEPPPVQQSCFRHVMATNRFNAAWKAIIDSANGHSHILSLESDVIPPEGVDIVQLMENNWTGEEDFLVHLYPYRESYGRPGQRAFEMGCTMAKTETWKHALETLPETAVLYWAVYQTKESNPHYNFTNRRIEEVELQHLE